MKELHEVYVLYNAEIPSEVAYFLLDLLNRVEALEEKELG
jgi:hypothetical protein